MHLTEASCDACPAKCRLEITTRGSPRRYGTEIRCVTAGGYVSGLADWQVGETTTVPDLPEIVVCGPPRGRATRQLFVCNRCPAPCLLETSTLPGVCPLMSGNVAHWTHAR